MIITMGMVGVAFRAACVVADIERVALGIADDEVFESLAIGSQEGRRAVRVQSSFFALLNKAKGSNQLRAIGLGSTGSVVFVPMLTCRA